MSEFLQGIIALIAGVVISVVTAYVTVQLSMKQFYSQKWWEKKAETYSNIIEHLSYLQYYFEEWFAEGVHEKELSSIDKERLSDGYRQARESIIKASAIGAFIVSDKTTAVLETLLRELDKKDQKGNWVGDIDRCYGSVKECIAKIRKYSEKELKKR